MVRAITVAGGAAVIQRVRAFAQEATTCGFICELEWKLEPTFTIENLANRHRVVGPDGVTERVKRARVFETILALDMKTRLPRLGVTVEAIAAPFSDDKHSEEGRRVRRWISLC